jgi:hypothetical protein
MYSQKISILYCVTALALDMQPSNQDTARQPRPGPAPLSKGDKVPKDRGWIEVAL